MTNWLCSAGANEAQLDFYLSQLPALPAGMGPRLFLCRQRLREGHGFLRGGWEFVAPLPLSMGEYPYAPKRSFPMDDAHVNYLLEYNTRSMSGNQQARVLVRLWRLEDCARCLK